MNYGSNDQRSNDHGSNHRRSTDYGSKDRDLWEHGSMEDGKERNDGDVDAGSRIGDPTEKGFAKVDPEDLGQ